MALYWSRLSISAGSHSVTGTRCPSRSCSSWLWLRSSSQSGEEDGPISLKTLTGLNTWVGGTRCIGCMMCHFRARTALRRPTLRSLGTTSKSTILSGTLLSNHGLEATQRSQAKLSALPYGPASAKSNSSNSRPGQTTAFWTPTTILTPSCTRVTLSWLVL